MDIRKTAIAAFLTAAALMLAGCNTVHGLGQDLQKGSEHVGKAIGDLGEKITEKSEAHGAEK